MRNTFIYIIICFSFFSCDQKKTPENTPKTNTSKSIIEPEKNKENTMAERIANANGFKTWENVQEIKFTINVDRGENHFDRSWVWKPKKDEVSLFSSTDTIQYNRSKMDSTHLKVDRGFINDKFWLLIPYNLIWDEGTTITVQDTAIAPISKERLSKLTILYGDEGGYTPGDAYDLYYGKDLLIKEWVFRKKNSLKPSMTTTWEDYEDFNGIKISKTRQNEDKTLKLYFTGIEVIR